MAVLKKVLVTLTGAIAFLLLLSFLRRFVPDCSESKFEPRRVQYPCESLLFPFCITTMPVESRVKDLISRLTLDEKLHALESTSPGIPRLGIPSYVWSQEALHGVATSPGVNFDGPVKAATSFPQPILTASSFNATLFTEVAQVISTEAHAMHNMGQSGLDFWAPNINMYRDPRWGRGYETPGEDPLLTSSYAVHFVRGMQEDQPTGTKLVGDFKLKTSACCKHFAAYDLENLDGVDRYHFNAVVNPRDMEDTFNPAFKACVEEGRASSIMCSYNQVNGVPACASYDLLTETARHRWGFNGYIVSDCDSVDDIWNKTHYAATPEDAIADAALAGMDLNCGHTYRMFSESAMKQGKLTEPTLDRALYNIFSVQVRLGLFDGNPKTQVHGNLGVMDVCTEESKKLALESALQGIVLLKNDNNTLPLSQKNIHLLAVVGPNAHDEEFRMLGGYSGNPCTYITPIAGLAEYAGNIIYEPGCHTTLCEENDFSAVANAAAKADAVVVVVGLSSRNEAEKLDRTSLLLPGQQQQLVSKVSSSARGPVVLVIMSGGPVDISFAKEDSRISSILWVGYPGQAGGQAIAEVVFGHRNPGGRLTMTWYPQSFTTVKMTNMNMRPDLSVGYPGRTYRFYTGEAVFSFGFGLSYSNFTYHFTAAPEEVLTENTPQFGYDKQNSVLDTPEHELMCHSLAFEVKVRVTNEGWRAGSDAVLLFWMPPDAGNNGIPLKQLVGFQRVHLEGGTETELVFTIQPCLHLTTVKDEGSRILDLGIHTLLVGNVKHLILFRDGGKKSPEM